MPGFGGEYSTFNDPSTRGRFIQTVVVPSMAYQNDSMLLDLPLCPLETEEEPSFVVDQPNQIELQEATALNAALPLESDERQKGSQNLGILESQSTRQLCRQNSPVFSDIAWDQYMRLSLSPSPSTGSLIRPSDRLVTSPRAASINQDRPLFNEDEQTKISMSNILLEGTDCKVLTKTLILVEDMFLNLLSQVEVTRLPWISADFVKHARAEFLDLISTSLEASASISRERCLSLRSQGQSWLPPYDQKLLATNWKFLRADAKSESDQYTCSLKPLYKAYFTRDTATGTLNFKLRGGISSDSSSITALEFTFVPSLGVYDHGFAATLMEVIDRTKNPRITCGITLFNILSYEFPIVQAVNRGDITEVQNLISSGKASFYDRTVKGNSLLSVSRGNYLFSYLLGLIRRRLLILQK